MASLVPPLLRRFLVHPQVLVLWLPWLLAAWPAHADVCRIAPVPMAALQTALTTLGRTPPPRVVHAPSRWLALLPTRLSAGMRDSRIEQTSWFISESSLTEKLSAGNVVGWTLRMDWDLRALWYTHDAQVIAGEPRLNHAQNVAHLAERVGVHLQTLRKAEALAMQLQEGDLLCQETQAEADAALLVLQTILQAARP